MSKAALIERFPEARVVRVDSDSMAGPGQVEAVLEAIRQREADIVVGTQMLSKGHHFAAVTLVCALNTDRGLYSFDFRASERLFQQLTPGCRASRARDTSWHCVGTDVLSR